MLRSGGCGDSSWTARHVAAHAHALGGSPPGQATPVVSRAAVEVCEPLDACTERRMCVRV